MGKKKLDQNEMTGDSATAEDFVKQAKTHMAILNQKATSDEKKAQHLRAYHGLGALSLKLAPDHKGYGEGVLKQHAEAIERDYNFVSRARHFASNYDAKQLQQLCQTPLGISHLRALIDIDNKRLRSKLQRQAHKQKLSVAALFALKKQDIKPKRGGGARVKIVDNPKLALLELLSEGETWVRRCKATLEKLSDASEGEAADLQENAEDGIKRLKAIAQAARQAEKDLKRLRDEG